MMPADDPHASLNYQLQLAIITDNISSCFVIISELELERRWPT